MKNSKRLPQCPPKIKDDLLKMAMKATEKIEVEEIAYARNKQRVAAKSKVRNLSDGAVLVPGNMSGKAYKKMKEKMQS